MIPSIYGYYKNQYNLSIVSMLTSLCSINYWISPINSWRLTLDKNVATISGIIYFFYGNNNIKNKNIKRLAFLNGYLIIAFYGFSKILYYKGSNYWLCSHMIFHFFTTTGKLLVIHYSV